MTKTARSEDGSSQRTTGSATNTNAGRETVDLDTGWPTATQANVFNFEARVTGDDQFAPGFKSVDSLIDKLEAADPEGMRQARRWAADTLYPEERFTVRSLRLRMGLSQAALAKLIGSSQPHVARIERGTEDIQISTFRKLAEALGLDCNQMNEALRNQERAGRG